MMYCSFSTVGSSRVTQGAPVNIFGQPVTLIPEFANQEP